MSRQIDRSTGLRRLAAAGLLMLTASNSPDLWAVTPVAWKDWAFEYDISGLFDGISLTNITFQGHPLIKKLSFPVMRVFYKNDACGPYADRLGGRTVPVPWANNSIVAEREFTGPDGRLWYEVGIRDLIGNYDIYQVYYLSSEGVIDAHVYSRGLQCVVDHIHYPNWRIDFNLDGPSNDVIQYDAGAGFVTLPVEFDQPAKLSPTHAWRVRDAVTGLKVDVLPGFPDFSLGAGNTNVPVKAFANNTVFGRLFKAEEDIAWRVGPNVQVQGKDGESIDKADVVLWYEGYMPHAAVDGQELWHSTGVRLAMTPPPPKRQTFAGRPFVIADRTTASLYPSEVKVADMIGVVKKVTVQFKGLSHTYPDDIDIGLVGPSGKGVRIMSDVGGSTDLKGVTLTLDGAAAAALPDNAPIASGTYQPFNAGDFDTFPAPAPFISGTSNLSAFNGTNPNGVWRLFVVDDAPSDTGALTGGWTLTIETQ